MEAGRVGVKRMSSCSDELASQHQCISMSQQPSISSISRSHRSDRHEATLETSKTQMSEDACAFKFGRKNSNVLVGRGRVVGHDIDPSGGLAVLQDPVSLCALVIVGCPDEKAFRLYQGVYKCTYITCLYNVYMCMCIKCKYVCMYMYVMSKCIYVYLQATQP
jgi:hypothetical protein